MARPTSEIHVVNLALALLHQAPISSITSPRVPAEDSAALIYDQVRRETLRSYIPNFARTYLKLTVSGTETPAFGYSNAFKLPNDFIRLLALGSVTINADTPESLYSISGEFIYTDHEDDTDTIKIYYIKDVETVRLWDALFIKLMRFQLAYDLGPDLGVPSKRLKDIREDLKDVKAEAAAISGQEDPPRRIERSRLLAARIRGGGNRDLTRLPRW